MKKETKLWGKWISFFTFAVAIILVYKLLDNYGLILNWIKELIGVLTPIAAGVLIAYIFYVPCRNIENAYKKVKKVKLVSKKARPLSILTVYILAILILIIVINFIMPPIAQSIVDLANNIGEYYDATIKSINEMPDDSFLKNEVLTKVLDGVNEIDLKQLINAQKLTEYAHGVVSFAGKVFDIVVAFIVSIYILNSRSSILKFFRRLSGAIFNKKIYLNIDKYFNRTNEIFFHFLASQIIDAILVGIIAALIMSIMGVKYAVLLGFIIGLFNLIPYFGAIIAIVIAGIITLLTGGISQTIWMLVAIIIFQQIDANVINPKIVGNSLEISPILVIFAVTVGGAYFGVIGMFLAVPIATVLKIMLEDFIEYREQKKKNEEEKIEIE